MDRRAGSTEWVDELAILIDDCFDRNNFYNDLPDSRRAAFFMHPPRLRRRTSLRTTQGYSQLKVRYLSTQNRYGPQTDARVDGWATMGRAREGPLAIFVEEECATSCDRRKRDRQCTSKIGRPMNQEPNGQQIIRLGK